MRVRVLEDAKNRAVIPADGVFNGLNMMMLNGTIGDVEQRRLFVRKMALSSQAEELRMIRGKPVQKQFGVGQNPKSRLRTNGSCGLTSGERRANSTNKWQASTACG